MPAPDLTHEPQPLTLEAEKLRMVVYGDFGRGKTTFAGTFPRPLIIDTNGGLVGLAINGVIAETFEPTGHEDLEGLYFWIKERVDNYDTIVIDTIDSLVYLLMDEITEDAVDAKVREGKKVTLRMQFVPEQGDYFASQRQMNRFLIGLRRLGKHIVITSSFRTKSGRTAPNVSDGMERVICDFASVIGELVIIDEVSDEDREEDPELFDGCRVLLTNESNARATKCRLQSLKPYVVEPTADKVLGLIESEYQQARPTKAPAKARATRKRGK